MLEPDRHEAPCPDAILALIPWYPDGALTASERGAVEAHAAGCEACREEIQALLGGFEPPADLVVPPAAKILARVLERIERAEAEVKAPRAGTRSGAAPARRRVAGRGGRLALAASLALAAGLGFAASLLLPRLPGAESYHTAAAPNATGAGGPVIEMIPRDGVSAAQLRAALQSIEGVIIAGPEGTLGRYQVRLPEGTDAAAAAARLRAEEGGIAVYAEALRR